MAVNRDRLSQSHAGITTLALAGFKRWEGWVPEGSLAALWRPISALLAPIDANRAGYLKIVGMVSGRFSAKLGPPNPGARLAVPVAPTISSAEQF